MSLMHLFNNVQIMPQRIMPECDNQTFRAMLAAIDKCNNEAIVHVMLILYLLIINLFG
jgi:hypothetical protein